MKDKDIANAIGILPTSFSTQYKNSKNEKKRYQYLIMKIGASIVSGESDFVVHEAVVNTKKINELCEKLKIDPSN